MAKEHIRTNAPREVAVEFNEQSKPLTIETRQCDASRITVLEFFSGVGGWHLALAASRVSATVVGAFELNPNANAVYAHNFAPLKPRGVNIEKLSVKDLDSYRAGMWVMSPPCQPFTRLGKRKDCRDSRTGGCLSLLAKIPELAHAPRVLLLENVQGFEVSETRERIVQVLLSCGYQVEEFLLDPRQLGLPNARLRYYLIATKCDSDCMIASGSGAGPGTIARIRTDLPPPVQRVGRDTVASAVEERSTDSVPPCFSAGSPSSADVRPLRNFLEDGVCDSTGEEYFAAYAIPDRVLTKSGGCLDIVFPDSHHTCCFTKAYSQYAKGTGSVLAMGKVVAWTAAQYKQFCRKDVFGAHHADCLEVPRDPALLRSLRLRYFSPREVANLLGFPASFSFPPEITRKQRYKLLGNSVSVPVLIRLLEYAVLPLLHC